MSWRSLVEVGVELDATDLGGSRPLGMLRRVPAGTGAVVSFAYDPGWLSRPEAFVLDPDHGRYPGDQFPRRGDIAAIFSDAAPDRWGRSLLERQEAVQARDEGRRRRTLGEWEFLLGVSDFSRMGALRFISADGRYLDDTFHGVPPVTSLGELKAAAGELERPSRAGRSNESVRLALLLAPGSSLGGARPKASYQDPDGTLWMAKFPSHNDRYDVGACEFVLNELAASAGIDVPDHRLHALGGDHRTFAARRFDRAHGARRLYASAMTMTQKRDREDASYLDIALAINEHGAPGRIGEDLEQLFRRVVFNTLTSHRDDHLRNHGFLRSTEGWRQAPAFDLNPTPAKPEHELSLDGAVHRGDLDVVLETAPFYRLSEARAMAIVDHVQAVLSGWRDVARESGVADMEADVLAEAITA